MYRFGDGYVLVGLEYGSISILSVHEDEVQQLITSAPIFHDQLNDVTYCDKIRKGAGINDNCIKVFDLSNLTHFEKQSMEKHEVEQDVGKLDRVEWTEDGQILTVSSQDGYIKTFLTSIPVLNDSYQSKVVS